MTFDCASSDCFGQYIDLGYVETYLDYHRELHMMYVPKRWCD